MIVKAILRKVARVISLTYMREENTLFLAYFPWNATSEVSELPHSNRSTLCTPVNRLCQHNQNSNVKTVHSNISNIIVQVHISDSSIAANLFYWISSAYLSAASRANQSFVIELRKQVPPGRTICCFKQAFRVRPRVRHRVSLQSRERVADLWREDVSSCWYPLAKFDENRSQKLYT